MLSHWKTTRVIMDGHLHTFNHGTPFEYVTERAVMEGVATYTDDRDGHTTRHPRSIIVTRDRGREELYRLAHV